jgi:hypothetical protein
VLVKKSLSAILKPRVRRGGQGGLLSSTAPHSAASSARHSPLQRRALERGGKETCCSPMRTSPRSKVGKTTATTGSLECKSEEAAGGEKLSVEEVRRRRREARFSNEQKEADACLPSEVSVSRAAACAPEADGPGAGTGSQVADGLPRGEASQVQVRALPEAQRRLRRAERFGGPAEEDTQAPCASNASKTGVSIDTLDDAHLTAETSAPEQDVGCAKRRKVASKEVEWLRKHTAQGASTSLRQIQLRKRSLARRHAQELKQVRARQKLEMDSFEARERQALAAADEEERGKGGGRSSSQQVSSGIDFRDMGAEEKEDAAVAEQTDEQEGEEEEDTAPRGVRLRVDKAAAYRCALVCLCLARSQ